MPDVNAALPVQNKLFIWLSTSAFPAMFLDWNECWEIHFSQTKTSHNILMWRVLCHIISSQGPSRAVLTCSIPMKLFSPKKLYQIQGRLDVKGPQNFVCRSVWGINGGVWLKTGDKKPSLVGEEQFSVGYNAFFFLLVTFQRNFPCLLFLQRQIHLGKSYIRACSSILDIVLWSFLFRDK